MGKYNNIRTKISNVVATQLPEFVRSEYPTFVAFVEAYYEFLEANQVDISKVRDIDTTLDEFIKHFKSELAHNYPNSASFDTERYLLKHIKDQYLAKGSEASYKLLFRLLYGKDVFMEYPGKQMLRVSDGRWQQDISLFVRVDVGNPIDLIGKIVDIQTSKKIYISTPVDGYTNTAKNVTKVTANIENVVPFDANANIYEVFLNRNFYGEIFPGDVVKYGSVFQGQILPVTSKIKIQNRGVGFKPGQVFQVSSGDGTPLWFKVLTIQTYEDKNGAKVEGGLKTIDLIRFGLNYNTDFSLTVLPSSAVSTNKKIKQQPVSITYSVETGTISKININSAGFGYLVPPTVEIGGVGGVGASAHTVIEDGQVVEIVVDNPGFGYESAFVNIVPQAGDPGSGAEAEPTIGFIYNYAYTDATSGFSENGYLNYGDYWASDFSDGAYVGTICRQFFVDAKDTASNDSALLNVSLGALARYPGYYKTNDGFLDDSMFIQDSYYYQAFSYVVRIDQQLDTYAAVVRTMLHPSGMAMFGEYSINNKIDLAVGLQSLVKSLGITLYDSAVASDEQKFDQYGNVIRGVYYSFSKDLNTASNVPVDEIQSLFFVKKATDDTVVATTPQLYWYFVKKLGLTGQSESVFAIDDGSIKQTTKVFNDSTSLVENFAKIYTGKAFTENQPILDVYSLYYTLNTIDDPLPGVYPEIGYVVLNPYDEGSYQAEHYSNNRDSTFST